jgi:probable HAF family extracellular repeat protein
MRVSSFNTILLAACFFQTSTAQAAGAPSFYAFKEIPYASGSQGMQNPLKINNAGVAAGYSGCCGTADAAIWAANAGPVTTLNDPAPKQNYRLDGINNAGQVVGSYHYSGTTSPLPASAWRFDKLPTGWQLILPPFIASAINDQGQILADKGALYNQNSELLFDFSTLGGTQKVAMALNNGGLAVGFSTLAGDAVTHAALWQAGVATDLGTLGGLNSRAFDINDDAVVVGESQTAGNADTHAVRWNGGVATDLGALPGHSSSRAVAINKAGFAVGYSVSADGRKRATLWDGGTAIDLNNYLPAALGSQGIVLSEAVDINDAGQILVKNLTVTSSGYVIEPLGVGYLMSPAVAPVVACTASYKITSTHNLIGFAVKVTVSNLGDVPLSGWNVGWTYSANPFIIASNNAKLKVSGATVKATPVTANQTIPAKGSTAFTFTSLKGKTIPTVNGLTADLGGKTCTSKVE